MKDKSGLMSLINENIFSELFTSIRKSFSRLSFIKL